MPKVPATTKRVVIEGFSPQVDAGKYPAKRIVDRPFLVEADVFCDGHDRIAVMLRHRKPRARGWVETPMADAGNDRWRVELTLGEIGSWELVVEGWVDHFDSWRHGLEKKVEAGVDVSVDLLIGSELVAAGADRARGIASETLARHVSILGDEAADPADRLDSALSAELAELMRLNPDRSRSVRSQRYPIFVDRERAGFSTWYELFPRSWSFDPDRHGTFADVEKHLRYVADMGFDVLYLPPIHPIGTTFRKGRNNTIDAGPDDPGVPWAIGSPDGGHTEIDSRLGTIGDFRSLREATLQAGMELAIDIAFQCSPDHPWVREHPEWFKHRPDGSVQYAENPPKKYQDIYPLDFETSDATGLWAALKGVFDHWIQEGVRIFRVDNPHTKAFAFWEWVIAEIRREHPEVIFLSEAFTRPKVMYRLAKIGFTQSYTYFAWRNTKHELMEYMGDLAQVGDFFRPNFWPNTPDILTEALQTGGRPTFVSRYVLAATLSANCGIYGPAFELMEHQPLRPGSEEYLDSEKYQIRLWDLDRADSLAPVITRVNLARRGHPALQQDELLFHHVDNDRLIAYSKSWEEDSVLVVVNLDPHYVQSGWVEMDPSLFGIEPGQPYQVHDLLTDRYYLWHGDRNFVQLDPAGVPAHVFAVRSPARTEQSFEYFA